MEHIKFPKMQQLTSVKMSITQKLNGTNAQVYIYKEGEDYKVLAGSRNRWVTVENDNHGFAAYIEEHRQEFIDLLGEGRHYGEWVGKGINNGEGLEDGYRRLYLFNHKRWFGKPLPQQCHVVPVLYDRHFCTEMMWFCINKLKSEGSRLVSGFMDVEGAVVEVEGRFFKHVFEPETMPEKKSKPKLMSVQIFHLLQPLRLKKLLSKDEQYVRDFPNSMSQIFTDYIQDLIDEKQIDSTAENFSKVKKALGKVLFKFIKENMYG